MPEFSISLKLDVSGSSIIGFIENLLKFTKVISYLLYDQVVHSQATVCLMRRYDPRIDGPTAMPKHQGRQEEPRARRLYPPTQNPTEWHELHGQSFSTDYDPPGAPWRPDVVRKADVVGKGRTKFMP